MKKTSQAILILSLIIGLTFSVSAAEIGEATLTAITLELSKPVADRAINAALTSDAAEGDFNSAAPQITAPTVPSLSLAPKRMSFGDAAFNASMISLVALNVADYFSTKNALKIPGLVEGNPLMKPFVKNDILFASVKVSVTALNYLLVKNIYKKNKVLGWVLSITANMALGYVVYNNSRLANQAKAGM